VVLAGDEDDRLEAGIDFARATPEKALVDMAYLAASPRSAYGSLGNVNDASELDLDRLRRLADAVGVRDAVEECLDRVAAEDDAEDEDAGRNVFGY